MDGYNLCYKKCIDEHMSKGKMFFSEILRKKIDVCNFCMGTTIYQVINRSH